MIGTDQRYITTSIQHVVWRYIKLHKIFLVFRMWEVNWFNLAWDRDQCWTFWNALLNLRVL